MCQPATQSQVRAVEKYLGTLGAGEIRTAEIRATQTRGGRPNFAGITNDV